MTNREKRVHELLYSCESRDEMCERVARMEEECEKLRAERDEWHRVAQSKQDIIDHMRDANAENAKLRELVAQMYPRAKAFLQMGVQLGCNDTLSYDWELQMQELGVEVTV